MSVKVFVLGRPGSGKTTAVMAKLLRTAAEKKTTRHVFVVLPYVNIIKQSVEVYRKALVLDGEDPDQEGMNHPPLSHAWSLRRNRYRILPLSWIGSER